MDEGLGASAETRVVDNTWQIEELNIYFGNFSFFLALVSFITAEPVKRFQL